MTRKVNLGLALIAALGASMLVTDTAEARHRRGGGSFGGSFGGFFSRGDDGCGSHGGRYHRHDNGCGSHGGRHARHDNGCGSHGGGYVEQNDCCGGSGGYSHHGSHDGGYVDNQGVYVEGDRVGERAQSETRYYGGTSDNYQQAPPAPVIGVDVDDDRDRDERDREDANRDRDDASRNDQPARDESAPEESSDAAVNPEEGSPQSTLEPPADTSADQPADASDNNGNDSNQ